MRRNCFYPNALFSLSYADELFQPVTLTGCMYIVNWSTNSNGQPFYCATVAAAATATFTWQRNDIKYHELCRPFVSTLSSFSSVVFVSLWWWTKAICCLLNFGYHFYRETFFHWLQEWQKNVMIFRFNGKKRKNSTAVVTVTNIDRMMKNLLKSVHIRVRASKIDEKSETKWKEKKKTRSHKFMMHEERRKLIHERNIKTHDCVESLDDVSQCVTHP